MNITYPFNILNKQLQFHGTTCYAVLASTSSTVKINGISKMNSARIRSTLTRDNRVPSYSILYNEKYYYDGQGIIGILCGYYIRFMLL